jgi:hypothetical protein
MNRVSLAKITHGAPMERTSTNSQVLQRPQTERSSVPRGAIICDVDVAVPGMNALLPCVSQAPLEMITSYGTNASYPLNYTAPEWPKLSLLTE